MNQAKRLVFKSIWYLSIVYFSYLMLLITVQYIPIDFEVAFLRVKEEAMSKMHYQLAFFSHVYTSIIVLLVGITQFSETIRKRYAFVHRNLGKLYVLLVLVIASPSGFIMALYANGGIYSKISFGLQAILWFYFTFAALRFARQRKWEQHQQFMIRSYALTLSAISLRLFKWIIANTLELPPMDTYRIVSWLGWIFNLVIAELYIYYFIRKNNRVFTKNKH
ncbi:DUF2306 domain-containing protein [Portibacter lacus]|uniref:DUF2306 domain-containing protein n=1 Tax=Portibacter lacus TaxID=1099794 RepID=A0AA37SSV5_9BACT|nr:DUF2306 domain-containing protein [Portibacter lacus]GLR17435.1 hypothetical protein GCM10007940_20500 [Portibacter lacus]